MRKKILGVLGGMGPAASARFFTLLTSFTKAQSDAEHIKTVIVSASDIPDRTAFITGKSADDPLPAMKNALASLHRAGAEVIAVPCNTADFFYSGLREMSPYPILRAAHTCVSFAARKGVRKLGVLATDGAVKTEVYQKACAEMGIEVILPCAAAQEKLNGIIYGKLKRSELPDKESFRSIASELLSSGCDAIALGCTELSLIPMDGDDEKFHFIDSLSVLARESILACGYDIDERFAEL